MGTEKIIFTQNPIFTHSIQVDVEHKQFKLIMPITLKCVANHLLKGLDVSTLDYMSLT